MATLEHIDIRERVSLTAKGKKWILGTILLGIVLFVSGLFITDHKYDVERAHAAEHHASTENVESNDKHDTEHASTTDAEEEHGGHGEFKPSVGRRVISALWLNNVFFTGIAVIGMFFLAYTYLAFAGWSAGIQRIPMSFIYYLPLGLVLFLVLFFIGKGELFHWTTLEPGKDELIDAKRGFLNEPSFIIRGVIYYVLWIVVFYFVRRNSLKEDGIATFQQYGEIKYSFYNKNMTLSAIFLVIFAVTSSMSAWDWIMSIDAHWFSTMFGWYVFASWHVTGIAVIALFAIVLKQNGHLRWVNESTIHDLGKFIFAFSIFWTYVWFSQFLLYFYSNIPEETVYLIDRLKGFGNHITQEYDNTYTIPFVLALVLNFLTPLIGLMTRNSKRKLDYLKVVASIVILGHFIDFMMMIYPGVNKQFGFYGFVGFIELGLFLIFGGVFVLLASIALSKANLASRNHPMLQESLYHDC